MNKGILKFKSEKLKFSFKITDYEAALLLSRLAEINPNPESAKARARDADGKFKKGES